MKKMYIKSIETILKEKWWHGLLMGILFIILGILLFVWPGLTSNLFIMLIGLVAVIFGVYRLLQLLFYKEENATQPKAMLIIESVAGIIIGLMAFFFPSTIQIAMILIIGAWMLYYGFFEFWSGFSISKGKVSSSFKWFLVLNGLLSIIVGIFIILNPFAGLLGLLWIIATYAIIFGILHVVQSFLHPNRK